jgi:hypothetical protein
LAERLYRSRYSGKLLSGFCAATGEWQVVSLASSSAASWLSATGGHTTEGSKQITSTLPVCGSAFFPTSRQTLSICSHIVHIPAMEIMRIIIPGLWEIVFNHVFFAGGEFWWGNII